MLAARTWAATPAEQCGTPQLPPSTAANIFSDEQQVVLGDLMADLSNDRMESIDDPEMTAYLQKLGEGIVRHLPPSHLQYRFYLADMPVANALSMVGGRVYVTRKLVASVRSEDELAGVIGHELGHIVTHQQAADWTLYLNKALGVTSVSDRKDIEDKVDRVFQLSSLWKLSGVRNKTENEQQEADRVGMEAVVLAGYRADALPEFWDRFSENKGKTGSWLSELFQTTGRNTKRYREMLKLLPKMPSNCLEVRPAAAQAEFQAWQKKVAAYRGTGRKESLHKVEFRRELEPPLQDELRTLRFSPNGKYFLAQDSGTVWVVQRNPLKVLFQFAAPNAAGAMFSADSSEVVVYDGAMRIERWDIASQERTDVYEVSSTLGCYQFTVAPDGNTLACLDNHMTLALIDTETNERFFERKDFHHWTTSLSAGFFNVHLASSNMGFSPDGRYFVAASGTAKPVAYDLKERREMPMPGPLADMLKRDFTFLGSDRIVGVGGAIGNKTRVARFPSGDLVAAINTGNARVTAAAHGDYLLIRPIENYAVGVLDIGKNALIRANKKRAFDVYDGTFLSELGNGEIGLFQEATTPIATLKLPRGRLGRLEAHSVSKDLHWLALSEGGRGAVWDLTTGAELYNVKGFQGSHMGADGALYVDFPAQGKVPRSIVRLGLESKGMGLAQSLEEDEQATEHEGFLTVVRPIEKPKAPTEQAKLIEEVYAKARGDYQQAHRVDVLQRRAQHVILEVKDVSNGKSLWSRRFEHEMPHMDYAAGNIVLRWPYDDEGAKAVLQGAPEKDRLRGEKGDYLLEVVDASNGTVRGRLLVAAAKKMFQVSHALAAGERVFVSDTRGRVLVYSLKDGSLAGHVWGRLRGLQADGSRFCVQPERGRLIVYDAGTLGKVDEFNFVQPVTSVSFQGKRMVVLTSNQTVYGLETP